MERVYEEIIEKLEGMKSLMLNYQNDINIDIDCIKDKQNVPFIHYLRENGSHIIFLNPVNTYPLIGQRVKYLFGYVNRYQLLDTKQESHDAIIKNFKEQLISCHYFNGYEFLKVESSNIGNILKDYKEKIERLWKKAI